MIRDTDFSKNIREDNRGVTLIELLTAVAIVAVVLGVVASFFITSLRVYRKTSNETTLQNEAQLAFTQIQSLTVNASDGVGLGEGASGTTGSDLYIYNHASDTREVTHIYLEENELYYCKISYDKNAAGEYQLGPDKQDPMLLAEYVTNFVVDMGNFLNNNSIDIRMDFKKQTREYTSTNTIYMRNQLVKSISGSAADYFDRTISTDAKYSDLRLTPAIVYVWPNSTTRNFLTAEVTEDGINYSTADRVVWEVSSTETEATINRNSGALTLKDAQTGGGGTITASVSSGDENNKTLTATAQYLTKTYDNLTLTNARPYSDDDHKTYLVDLTVEGKYLDPDTDMQNSPTYDSSTCKATFTKNAADSKQGVLKWTVSVKRPSDYTGDHYITVSYTLNGQTLTARLRMNFTASDKEKTTTIEKVRLVSGSTYYENNGTINMSRNSSTTVKMEALFAGDTTWTELDSDEWSIKPTGSTVTASEIGTGYTLSSKKVTDYAKTVTVDCTTTWYKGGQNGTGPTIQLKFNPVTVTLDNGAPSTQKAFPVTCGTTEQVKFKVNNLEGASVYILDKSDSQNSSTIRVSVNGLNASVTTPTKYTQKRTFYFGIEAEDGTELPSSICCEVGLVPGDANLYKNTSMDVNENTFVPLINSNFTQYDSTKLAPSGSGSVQIYTLSKGAITYTATSSTCKYTVKFNGIDYKFANPEYRISGWLKK